MRTILSLQLNGESFVGFCTVDHLFLRVIEFSHQIETLIIEGDKWHAAL